jgi:F0F1-type ATP synthase assembly protein I
MDNEKNKNEAIWWQPSLILFGRLSGWIGGPVVLALFLGKWLDDKYKTAPRFFLLCVSIAFVVSTFGIVKDAMLAIKNIDKEGEENKKKHNAEIEIANKNYGRTKHLNK